MSNLLVLQVIAVLKLLQVQYLNTNTTATFTESLVRSDTVRALCVPVLSPHNKPGGRSSTIPILNETQSERSLAHGHLAASAWHMLYESVILHLGVLLGVEH